MPSIKDTTQTGIADVHHQGNHAGQGTDDGHHGATWGQRRHGIGRNIRPHTGVPSTVLVADISDGELILQGWPDTPSAYQRPPDTVPLTQALAASFGSTQLALRGDRGEAR